MSKTGGGVRTVKQLYVGDSTYSGPINNIESLREIADPNLRKEIQSAISKFESRLKLNTTNIKIAELNGPLGIGSGNGVFLNSKDFKNGTVQSISKLSTDEYKSGFLTKTNKPVQHVTIHELSHALWTDGRTDIKSVAARKDISSLFSRYKKAYVTGKLKGHGQYSTANVNEFFAEITTKGVIGTSDNWTKSLFKIIDKYNLTL